MSDMHREPGRGPYRSDRAPRNTTPWIVVAVAVLAVIALLAWAMGDRTRTASSPTDQTTGQGSPARTPALGPAPPK